MPPFVSLPSCSNTSFRLMTNSSPSSMVRQAPTTVDIPMNQFARFAIQALQTQQAFPARSQVSMILPTKLIVRQSCGAQSRI